MVWLWIGGALVLGAVLLVNVNRLRWQRRVASEMQMLSGLRPSRASAPKSAPLPAPVARYRELAVGDSAPVGTLNLRHTGTFCMSPSAKPAPIRGTQRFTADPPGFVWSARVRLAPGLWVDVRDMAARGKGSMRVLLDATVPIVDASGPQLDQGSALRLLAEMVWYPSALFDARYVTWSAIDETHARASLRFGSLEVSGTFEFGSDGLPVGMAAERFMDKLGLRPWGGTYRDWRTVSGMRVPFEAIVTWQLETGPFSYAHWHVEGMDYDAPVPLLSQTKQESTACRPRHDGFRDVMQGVGGAAIMIVAFITPFLRKARNRWGLSRALAERAYLGDELVAQPRWSWTHGIEIEAPPERVWPWIAQMGAGRGGFYSYQWLENIVGCELQNAETIHEEWRTEQGGSLSLHPKMPALVIALVEPGRAFVAHAAADVAARAAGKPWAETSWLFYIEPLAGGRSRFISRFRCNCSDDLGSSFAFSPAWLEPVGFAMDRRMLHGVKERAEHRPLKLENLLAR